MGGKLASRVGLMILAVLLCGLLRPERPAQAQSSSAPSLYNRLGGYDAIAAVTDDFLGRLAADKQMSRFFVGVSADSLRKSRQHVVDQLCEASDGPCYYFGRSMKTVHAGLGITATVDKFKVPDKERNEILTLFASLKSDIVEKS